MDTIKKINKDIKIANELTVNELVKILKLASDAYYNTSEEVMTDGTFDILLDILKKKSPNSAFLKQVGAPIKVARDEVELPYPMGSLEKVRRDDNNLDKWLLKYSGPYNLSDKMDGISAQFYRQSIDTYKLYTRGNRTHGRDISDLIPYLFKGEEIPVGTSVRGEIIMSAQNFKNPIMINKKNPRNAVSGIILSKTQDKEFRDSIKLCDFIAYSIISPRYKQSEQYDLLQKYGFKIPQIKTVTKLSFDMLESYLKERRQKSPYGTDGIVVTDDSKSYLHPDINPDFAFAFKMQLDEQIVNANVIKVIWQVSKNGYLKPKIEIKPVDLCGVTITYATAFNAKFVVDNKLGAGAIVKLIRSGDVIPHILEVIKPAKIAQMPTVEYDWTDTDVDIYTTDMTNPDIIIKQITFFFKTIDAKFISEGVITKLCNAGYNSISKILKADKKKLSLIDGIGDKSITKIFDSIYLQLSKIDLATFMAASHVFGRGFGCKKLKEITNKYPDIMQVVWSKKELMDNIMNVDGYDTVSAIKFCNNFNNFKKFFNEINKIVDISHITKLKIDNVNNANKFAGKIFVFSGFRNKILEKLISDNGGKVSTSVSGNTSLLIVSSLSEESSKITTAKEKNIPIKTFDSFIKEHELNL